MKHLTTFVKMEKGNFYFEMTFQDQAGYNVTIQSQPVFTDRASCNMAAIEKQKELLG